MAFLQNQSCLLSFPFQSHFGSSELSRMFAKKEESSQILLVLSVKGMAELSATIAMAEGGLTLWT
uniref:Uncharacterized protein n=1 Tax=Solanum tuberosum TaxID=4113 RepID=M1B9W3_SOLTU